MIGRRERVRFGLELLVTQLPFDGVGAVCKDPFNSFVEEKARTIDKLVQHTRGQVVWKFNLDAPLGLGVRNYREWIGFRRIPHRAKSPG